MTNSTSTEQAPASRRMGCGGCLLICSGIAVACAAVAMIAAYVWHRRTETEVNALLDDIRSRGEPASAAELEAFYTLPGDAEDCTALWLKATADFDSQDFSDAFSRTGLLADTFPSPGVPWAEQQAAAELLEKYDANMQLMHEAARKGGAARYTTNFNKGPAMILPHVQLLREGARMLQLEALVRARTDDPDGVVESIKTTNRLGESLRNEPVMVSQLVRVAIAGINVQTIQHTIPHVRFSDEQLQQLSDMLKQTSFDGSLRRSLLGERVMGISVAQNPEIMADSEVRIPPALLNMCLIHYLQSMEEPLAIAEQPEVERLRNLEQHEETIQASVDEAGRVEGLLTTLLLPSAEAAAVATARANLGNQAARVAIACERYRRQHGTLPPRLIRLVPQFLEQIPPDPFDGQPLRYLVSENKVRIYSIGTNRVDDGGMGELENQMQRDPDIVYQFVWPLD